MSRAAETTHVSRGGWEKSEEEAQLKLNMKKPSLNIILTFYAGIKRAQEEAKRQVSDCVLGSRKSQLDGWTITQSSRREKINAAL